jgi:hypothetical protein
MTQCEVLGVRERRTIQQDPIGLVLQELDANAYRICIMIRGRLSPVDCVVRDPAFMNQTNKLSGSPNVVVSLTGKEVAQIVLIPPTEYVVQGLVCATTSRVNDDERHW